MKILHTGDLNITAHMDQKMNETLLKFLSEVKNSGADILVVAGDIVESGLEEDYYKAIEIFDSLSVEKIFLLVIGNFLMAETSVFPHAFMIWNLH